MSKEEIKGEVNGYTQSYIDLFFTNRERLFLTHIQTLLSTLEAKDNEIKGLRLALNMATKGIPLTDPKWKEAR